MEKVRFTVDILLSNWLITVVDRGHWAAMISGRTIAGWMVSLIVACLLYMLAVAYVAKKVVVLHSR